jgi:hypothetical protein
MNTYLVLDRIVYGFRYVQSASIKLTDPKTDNVEGGTDS